MIHEEGESSVFRGWGALGAIIRVAVFGVVAPSSVTESKGPLGSVSWRVRHSWKRRRSKGVYVGRILRCGPDSTRIRRDDRRKLQLPTETATTDRRHWPGAGRGRGPLGVLKRSMTYWRMIKARPRLYSKCLFETLKGERLRRWYASTSGDGHSQHSVALACPGDSYSGQPLGSQLCIPR